MPWRGPSAAEEGGDGEELVGRRVRVESLGDGTVSKFHKTAFGASAHTIVLSGGGEKKVKLARKGNGKTPWEIWAADAGSEPPVPIGHGGMEDMATMRVTLQDLGEAIGQELYTQRKWVPDDASKTCLLCGKGFSLTRRRHHCRACGNLLCAMCSEHKVVIVDSGSDESHRVCNPCHGELGSAGVHHGGGAAAASAAAVHWHQERQCTDGESTAVAPLAAAAGGGLSGTTSLIAKNMVRGAQAEELSRNSSVGHVGSPAPKFEGPPEFPTLGITLGYLETFVAQKVAGKRSRYGTTKVATPADERGDGCLVFKRGEIVAVADIAQFDDAAGGWYIGYRRAGDWAERKRFRSEHVQWLTGLSTDEVCGSLIKPETSGYAGWPAQQRERSYAQMALARGEAGIGRATVFASHAWTFVFEELVQSLRFFEQQQLAAGEKASLFWLDIFVVDENAA